MGKEKEGYPRVDRIVSCRFTDDGLLGLPWVLPAQADHDTDQLLPQPKPHSLIHFTLKFCQPHLLMSVRASSSWCFPFFSWLINLMWIFFRERVELDSFTVDFGRDPVASGREVYSHSQGTHTLGLSLKGGTPFGMMLDTLV